MKKIIVFCLAIPFFVSCSNITGSGNIISEERKLKEFTGISASGNIDVEVISGDAQKVEVEADDNVMEFIVTKVEGNTLKIRTRDVNLFNAHVKVYITAPFISTLKASASATIEAKDIIKSNGKITLAASSSADIIASVDAPEVVTDANSSGTVKVSGRTKYHKAESSSSAEILAYNLLSENTVAHANSSGSIEVHASLNLDASANSSGSIKYRGTPALKSNTNSSGSVEKE